MKHITIEEIGPRFYIAARDRFGRKVYFTGIRKGKPVFSLDYTYTMYFKNRRSAENKLYKAAPGYWNNEKFSWEYKPWEKGGTKE